MSMNSSDSTATSCKHGSKHQGNLGEPFTSAVLNWYDRHGRTSLPWQQNRTPYRVWVSEIMLQQTQVDTVVSFYNNFMQKFPDIASLASARSDAVMACWAGLGYYARARNMHKAAKIICEIHSSVFPDDFEQVLALPGIGRSTAGAILSFTAGQRHPILDGNVKRVLTRYHAISGYPGSKPVEAELWNLSDRHTPQHRVADYTQAIMDFGATLCTRARPGCVDCPVALSCKAFSTGEVDRFPERKKAALRKHRHTRMLLIRNNQGKYYLEKRPPAGIWGGLWCLPETGNDESDLMQWVRTNLGVSVNRVKNLDPISHSFTHFEMHIQPVLCTLQESAAGLMDAGEHLWYNPVNDTGVGVPAAVNRIFELSLPLLPIEEDL